MELEATLAFISNREIFIEMIKLFQSCDIVAVKTTAAVLNSRENHKLFMHWGKSWEN